MPTLPIEVQSKLRNKKVFLLKLDTEGHIENRILILRGTKVIIDKDLAELYGVSTKVLNQAVRRNIRRFPADFIFMLTKTEKKELVTKCDRFKTLKHSSVSPYAFTEHGVAMVSTVLKSEVALRMSILIIKTFVKLRRFASNHNKLSHKLYQLEKRVDKHDEGIQSLFEAIRQLMNPGFKSNKKIGFSVE